MLASVKRNWYAVMPESARLGDQGKVVLQFRIMRNGVVPEPEPVMMGSSGKEPLDRAAVSSIRASTPFEPLPPAFSGPYIELRFIFLYNIPLNSQTPSEALPHTSGGVPLAGAAVFDLSGHPVLEIPVMSAAPKLTPDQFRRTCHEPGATRSRSLPLWGRRRPANPRWPWRWPANWRAKSWPAIPRKSIAGFDIGTAKPTVEERGGVPHHLLDLVDPSFPFTAGEYRARAVAVLEDLRQRGRLPILTVGTGLYLRALLEGLADAPARSEELRARLEAGANAHSLQYLHRVLRRLDPEAALRIGSRDRPKMIRAIEVCLLTGRPLSEVHRAGRTPLEGYHPIKIGLQPPRAALYDRIERRTHTMLDRGWLDEVASLVRNGVPQNSKPFDFIGYSELRAHLEGTVTLAAATKAIAQATRRYAKRQLTWFRKEPLVHWLPGFGDDPAIVAAAEQLVAGNAQSRVAS